MALIVLQHTVVDNFNVDPNFSITVSGMILQGSLVGLDVNANTQKAGNGSGASGTITNTNGAPTANGIYPLGIAGDSIADEYQTTAYSAQLVIGRGQQNTPGGPYNAPKRWTSNRVSDIYNETLSSGKMSVYLGAGRFATDQYVTTDNWTAANGVPVYSNVAGLFTLNNNSGLARRVGYVLQPPSAYPSGVPGADAPSVDTSMSLGTFLQVSLSI